MRLGALVAKLVSIVVISVLAYYGTAAFLRWAGVGDYVDLVKGLAIAAGGLAAVNVVGNAVITWLKPSIGSRAYGVGNSVKVVGVLAVLLAALVVSRVGTELAVLGGAVTGLVLGLALQPVLGNMFAGLLILGTRLVTVGSTVRVVTAQVPYQLALLPAYKYFSPDYVAPGYKGKVVEVGLFYSTILLDTGYELRVPNMVLLSSGVVDYTPQWSERQVVYLRVELPLSVISIDTLEAEIVRELEGFDVMAVDYTEQSDKDYVIVRVKLRVPLDRDWRAVKSEALKRLLKFRDRKISENLYRYLCLTRGVVCDKLPPEQSGG
ncbi:MAG: mechanosensitive ion channel domain-containing protein [Pyrobaculum sp.]